MIVNDEFIRKRPILRKYYSIFL